jgi:nuclease S1
MPIRLPSAVSFCCYYLFCFQLNAWWGTGHRAVARIAESRLSPEAHNQIARIFGVRNTRVDVANAMAQASTWPDEIKANLGNGAWHYINLAIQDYILEFPHPCPAANCITARIEIFSRQIANDRPPALRDQDALRYLIHFLGDVHQPLHTISNADLGGNCESTDPFRGTTNLHALWDGGIVDAFQLNDTRLAAKLEAYISRLSSAQRDSWVLAIL